MAFEVSATVSLTSKEDNNMADLGTIDLVLHGANVAALVGGLAGAVKYFVPAGLSIRDSLRDSATALSKLAETARDHEVRIRELEVYTGPDRRRVDRG